MAPSKVARPGVGGGGRAPIAPAEIYAGPAADKFLFFLKNEKVLHFPSRSLYAGSSLVHPNSPAS